MCVTLGSRSWCSAPQIMEFIVEVMLLVRDSGEQIVGHVGDALAGREAGCLWWCVLLRSSSASLTCLLDVELGWTCSWCQGRR